MAKKLNKKVAIIGIILLVLVLGGGMTVLIGPKVARRLGLFQNPEKALVKAQQAQEAGDYKEAELQYGLSYSYGKTDEYKVERLFDLAEFHLINNDEHEAEWPKVMGCWTKIVSIDPENIEARRKLLDYSYQAADAGNPAMWRNVNETTTELIDVLKKQGTEPDSFLLIAKSKALLSIAQRGETTNREELLSECTGLLEQLLEKEPQNEELYRLMANAAAVEGELNTLAGVIDAQKKADAKALEYLETGVVQSDDKASSIANLMIHKLQRQGTDPNSLELIRSEIADRMKEIQPNAELWMVYSIAYENHGKLSAESEINRAIDAIQKAHDLEPGDFEYVFRLAQLLYRKGSTFSDPASVADALQIAEDALQLEEVQDAPGPLQGRNANYRFVLNNLLADLYLEKATDSADDETVSNEYIQKAEERIDEIISTLGTSDHPTAQKFRGLLALAKGRQDEAIPLLYTAYEANKALDTADQASKVDSRVCIALAKIAAEQQLPGLQAEFLQAVRTSADRLILQKPQLLLDFAEVLSQLRHFRGWDVFVTNSVTGYQNRYGANSRTQRLLLEVSIATSRFDQAREILASFEGTPVEKDQFELALLNAEVISVRQSIAVAEQQGQESSDTQTQQLETLRNKRDALLKKILSDAPASLELNTVSSICYDLINNDRSDFAVNCLDAYLAEHPNTLNLMVLRLQAQQEDPGALTLDQRAELREQAIAALTDELRKTILQADGLSSQEEYEKAIERLEQYSQELGQDDPAIIEAKFNIVRQQKDFDAADVLLKQISSKNIDQCGGNLAAARLEMAKENYPVALRRLDECLKLQPLSSLVHFLKSQVLQQLESQEEAIESARVAIRMNPRSPLYSRNLASLLFTRNMALGSKLTVEQEAEAEQAIQMAVQLNPSDFQLQSVLAEVIQSRDPDRALAIRQRLLDNYPTAPNALMLGNMALRMIDSEWDPAKRTGLIELAGKAYQKGLEIDPKNQAVLEAYANYQMKLGKVDAIEVLGGDKNLEWKFYLRAGQYEQASEILQELRKENPEDPLLIRGLVLVSQGAGKRDQIKEYLEVLNGVDDTKDTELWILQQYIDSGFPDEAEKKLESFRDRFPDEKAADLVQAWVLMGRGQLDEALVQVNRYLETDTNNPGGWRLRGRLFRLMGQPNKAIDDLQRSKTLKDTPAVRIELANVYDESNQVTAAIGELVPSLEDPQAPSRMRMMLEGLYKKSRRGSDLEKLYKSSQEKYPDNPFWYYRAGVYYLTALKQYAKAEELLEKAWGLCLEQKRPDPQVYDFYLDSLFQSKQYDRAMTLASSQIDTPLASISYAYMGQIQFALGQREKAGENFAKALDKAGSIEAVLQGTMGVMLKTVGEDVVTGWISARLAKGGQEALPAYMMASSLSQSKGAYNEAIEQLDRCIEIVGEDSAGWLGFALKKVNLLLMVYVKTGDEGYMTRATELLTAMLKVQPNNASLLNNMAYLLTDNDQQLETALDYARRAHLAEPANATYLDTYAYAQCKNGKYQQAEENLIRAIQIYEVSNQPIPWDLYKHFGMTKEGLEKTGEAVEMYTKALESSDQIPEEEQKRLKKMIERLQQN